MDLNKVKMGLKVKTTKLGGTGFIIPEKYTTVRQEGIIGNVIDYVRGYNGEIWWIKHNDGNMSMYHHDEFEAF